MHPLKGTLLTPDQVDQVKRAFIYRWIKDNPKRESVWRNISGPPTIPLISDEQWLAEHAFWFTSGGKLSQKHNHCEPEYMADDPARTGN
jgi:hypothetical protein